MRRTAAATLTTLAAIALTLTGCTSGDVPQLPSEQPPALGFDVGSKPDFGTTMVACMSEKGWPVSLGTDGSFKTDTFPSEQQDAYTADHEECLDSGGFNEQPPTLTDTQVREVYQHMLWEWKCLNDNGYDPETPLSEQSYLDDYHTHGSLWTPYSQYTATLSEDNITELFATCPRAF
ncbi:hypothetical protein G3H63_01780 [Microbacterium resistens]|uniref:hypothetical protein n=1 Tax=Microbacterium resistens TaxID=156977 RepID=UPI001C565437|nr:hypothetical protein [Microbacterium resistens]MBW1637817.1 hypothetical protein [Microbacterium resistens]